MNDPPDVDLLQRLRDADPVAPAQFCERFLPQLLADRRRWMVTGVRDEHLIEEAAIEAILSFVQNLVSYDATRLTLLPYLRMAARRDLQNLLAKERRHASRRVPLEAVELRPVAGNDEHGIGTDRPGIAADLLLRRLREQVPDPRDREAAALMLDGVRPTSAYARIYGLEHLPMEEQRRAVKRHKDRLDKVMKRLGERLRDHRA